MKRVGWVLPVSVMAVLAATSVLACDSPKKPPLMPDNDMGDAGVDMPDLAPPATPAPPKR